MVTTERYVRSTGVEGNLAVDSYSEESVLLAGGVEGLPSLDGAELRATTRRATRVRAFMARSAY